MRCSGLSMRLSLRRDGFVQSPVAFASGFGRDGPLFVSPTSGLLERASKLFWLNCFIAWRPGVVACSLFVSTLMMFSRQCLKLKLLPFQRAHMCPRLRLALGRLPWLRPACRGRIARLCCLTSVVRVRSHSTSRVILLLALLACPTSSRSRMLLKLLRLDRLSFVFGTIWQLQHI